MSEKKELILVRTRMLDNQLQKLKDQMTGRNNSFYPFITNKNGEITERKLSSFINELTNKPNQYVDSDSFDKYCYLNGKSYKKLCKCFLYCAIQGIAAYKYADFCPERTSSLFSDIVKLAEFKYNTFFKAEEELAKHEFENYLSEGKYYYSEELIYSCFFHFDALYSLLSGNSITEIFPKDLYDTLYSNHYAKEAEIYGCDSIEEYFEIYQSHDTSLDEEYDVPEDEDYIDYDEIMGETEEEHRKGLSQFKETYLKTVVSPQNYINNYLEFRKLYFKLSEYHRKNFFNDIVLMVDAFLYDHGLSPMTDNDIYAEFDRRSDRLYNIIKQKSEKRGE